MFVLAPCLVALIAAASAVPPPAAPVVPPQQQLAADFVDAASILDFSAATRLYDDILHHGHMDASAFTLAASIKRAMTSPQFETLEPTERHLWEAMKERLPTSARNAVFAARVCLRNIFFNEYLYAPSDEFLFDAQQRNVFSYILGGNVTGSTWILENTTTDTHWKVFNVEHQEYLFAAGDFYNNNRRRVFTWVPAWNEASTQNVWKLVSVGNDVYFQSVFFSGGLSNYEYMYVAENVHNYDANRRRIFAWDSAWTSGTSHYFAVEAC